MKLTLFLMMFVLIWAASLYAQPESWYIERIARALDGQTEVVVDNGRAGVLTDEYAIEVERAAR